MKRNILGRSGIEVTELCFGALPMGPLQKDVGVNEAAELVEAALKGGVTFVDTAQSYRTYEPIKIAMDRTGIRPVIASKSMKKTYGEMEHAVNEALDALGIDYIDIFHLHAAREGADALESFGGALKCLVDMKRAGKVRAIGISTHSVAAANRAVTRDEIDIIFPLINKVGRGILDGTRDEMAEVIYKASAAGKGIYLMKALAGGSLIDDFDDALKYARSVKGYSSIAVGMVNLNEVDFNIRYFNGDYAGPLPKVQTAHKKIKVVQSLCKGCGRCAATCPNGALHLENSKAAVDTGKCITCGYCTPVCPEFAIRIV